MPRRYRVKTWDELNVGEEVWTGGRTVTEGDVLGCSGLTGDFNPLHTDEEFAKKTPFGGRIAHGLLTLGISGGQQNQLGLFEGTTLALLGMDKLRFTGPVRFGDTIHTELTVKEAKESSKPDRGVVVFDTVVKNQRGETVLQFEQSVLLMRRH